MRLSIQRLRWVLLAGAVLLLAVLAGFIGYGRWRATQAYIRIIQRAGVHITHDTNGFTYSQSVQGRTIFTLHAKTATQIGDGKWSLHDAAMTLYNRIPDRPDHVYGSEVEYDENTGVARAVGEVHMDLQAPEAFAESGHASTEAETKAANEHVIHVKTSGLVYLRKLGVAATDQQVEFTYNGMHCTAMGAEFNTGSNVLRLLKDVTMDAVSHDKPVHLTALQADIERNDHYATLDHPVVTSQGRTGSADSGLVNFESDGSIQRIQGNGEVVLSEGTREMTAAHLDALLNHDMQFREAHLTGGVGLIDTDPIRPMQGSASRVDAAFDLKGEPTSVTATGGAHVAVVDHRSNAQGLSRSMEGAKIVAVFVPAPHATGEKQQRMLSEVEATGAARASGESLAVPPKNSAAIPGVPAFKTTRVNADDLRVSFVRTPSGGAQPKHLTGIGHTVLEQLAPLGEHETSAGDALEMNFAEAKSPDVATSSSGSSGLMVSSAVQTGHVVIHDQAASTSAGPGELSNGTAQLATYEETTAHLTLTGDVHWMNDRGQLVAPRVVVDQKNQDADAMGGVEATLFNAGSPAAGSAGGPAAGGAEARSDAAPSEVTHILAASAAMHHATQVSEFRGSDAEPAKMWQGGSQVQAARLLFDGARRTFSARPAAAGTHIHAVMVGTPTSPKPGEPARAATVLRVASPKMDYNDVQREATFSGGVIMEGSLGDVRGQRAVVFLTALAPGKKTASTTSPAQGTAATVPFGGSVDRLVVYGDVRLDQPGRRGTGDELLYTASTGSYVLTGTPEKPPLVVDAEQGSVTGKTLLFGDAGSTIVVAGRPGSRVRTETEVRQP